MPAIIAGCEVDNTIKFYVGQSMTYELCVLDEDTEAAINITNSLLYLTVRECDGGDVIIALTSTPAAGITITDAINGLADIDFSPSDTSALSAGTYIYDAWIELESGKRYPIIPRSEFILCSSLTTFP